MNPELLTQIQKGNIEVSDSGLIFPVLKTALSGMWKVQKNDEPWEHMHNVVTVEGATLMLNVMFGGATPINPWYIGLYEGVFTPAASHGASDIVSTFDEITRYVNATRPAWVEATASAGSITDSVVTTFECNATGDDITGAFLVSNSTRLDTTGTVFSVANFTTAKPLASGDTLSVGYTITAADAG